MNGTNYRLKYVLVGASGTGKSTMAGILEQTLGFRRCITSTSRPMRPGECDGKDYYFCSRFDPKEMFEMATFGGYQYGITHKELTRGDFIILEPQGVQYYRQHYPHPLTVIQLKRDNIQVDPARMARDMLAGFDSVNPDIVVTGETIDTMATNLLDAIAQQGRGSRLDDLIAAATTQKEDNLLFASAKQQEKKSSMSVQAVR